MDKGVSFSFEVNGQWCIEGEVMLQALMGGLINVNHSRGAFAGDSAGQIDRVTP